MMHDLDSHLPWEFKNLVFIVNHIFNETQKPIPFVSKGKLLREVFLRTETIVHFDHSESGIYCKYISSYWTVAGLQKP